MSIMRLLRKVHSSITHTYRTRNQEIYVKALRNPEKPIVIAVGPAGSGKTFLACNEGLQHLLDNNVRNMVITRPTRAVDEELGFLPGNINKKLAPWVQPIYDSLKKTDTDSNKKLRVKDKIEIAPLGYMRGRTFDSSWIIADEMQNATPAQTKMLLTRLGEGSKLVVTGDLQQQDIHYSGLQDFLDKLQMYDAKYIEYVELDGEDIIRHEAVKEVINIYDSV